MSPHRMHTFCNSRGHEAVLGTAAATLMYHRWKRNLKFAHNKELKLQLTGHRELLIAQRSN